MTTPEIRKPGRPSLLTEETKKALLEAVRLGAPVELCAAAAGVGESTFYTWMAEGREEHARIEAGMEPREDKERFLDFYREVTANRVSAAVRSVGAIQKAVAGGTVIEETTRTFRDHDGQMVTEKTVKKAAPDWRAGAWYLERQFGRFFGKAAQEIQLTGADGGPIQVTTDAADLSRRLTEHLAAGGMALALPAAAEPDIEDAVLELESSELAEEQDAPH